MIYDNNVQITYRHTRTFRDKWLREGYGTTPFSVIQRLDHYCTTIAMSHTSPPNVEWVQPNKIVAAFGYTIAVDSFALMYSQILDSAKELFQGLTSGIATRLPSLTDIVDTMRSPDPEYSFLGRQNSQMMSLRSRLLTWAAQQGGYLIGARDGQLQWNSMKMLDFMTRAQKLNEMLMFLM
jgi:hypothetical protein